MLSHGLAVGAAGRPAAGRARAMVWGSMDGGIQRALYSRRGAARG